MTKELHLYLALNGFKIEYTKKNLEAMGKFGFIAH